MTPRPSRWPLPSHRSFLGIVVQLDSVPDRGADANKDRTDFVPELQIYVINQVCESTEVGQDPILNWENLESDFAVC